MFSEDHVRQAELMLRCIPAVAERSCFVVYLAGHNRPMHELLAPRIQSIADSYHGEFQGMSQLEVGLEELQAVQQMLPEALTRSLDADEKAFLLSMKSGDPDWAVLGIESLERMPALQWKLLNIRKMDARKREEQLNMLQELFGNG